jgi:hypothetical protein
MFLAMSRLLECSTAFAANKRPQLCVHHPDVSRKAVVERKTGGAVLALEVTDLLVHTLDVLVEITFFSKPC